MAPVSWWLAYRWNEPDDPTVVVELNSKSELLVDKRKVDRTELAKWVKDQIARRNRYGMKTHLRIRASRDALHEDLLTVFSVLEEVRGVDKISLYTAIED